MLHHFYTNDSLQYLQCILHNIHSEYQISIKQWPLFPLQRNASTCMEQSLLGYFFCKVMWHPSRLCVTYKKNEECDLYLWNQKSGLLIQWSLRKERHQNTAKLRTIINNILVWNGPRKKLTQMFLSAQGVDICIHASHEQWGLQWPWSIRNLTVAIL